MDIEPDEALAKDSDDVQDANIETFNKFSPLPEYNNANSDLIIL